MDSIKSLIVISIVLLGTYLIYQDVKGSPDIEKIANDSSNKAINDLMNRANQILALANASNVTVTDANISGFNNELSDNALNDNEFDDNSGVGYYDPPYSYAQCLTVFTKEMCDFRFNGN